MELSMCAVHLGNGIAKNIVPLAGTRSVLSGLPRGGRASFYLCRSNLPASVMRGGFILPGAYESEGMIAMEANRIAVAAVIVEDLESARAVNDVLHKFSGLIVGRLGIPYRERGVSVISVVLDGTTDEISALTGQLGKIGGVTVKAVTSKK